MDWNKALQDAHLIIEGEESNKRQLWRLAFDIKKEFGGVGLKEFSDNLKESFGLTRSYHTLRQYAYVYEMMVTYDIPEDIPYTAIRAILSSQKPLDYIKLMKDGASYQEILFKIHEDKPQKEKEIKCPNCGKVMVCSCTHSVTIQNEVKI